MNSELFNRLKKISGLDGKVIVIENDEAFVLMPLDEYENCMGGECECGRCEDEDRNEDNGIEEVVIKDDTEETETPDTNDDDKELLRKVNEDIAKWRAEQEQSQEHKNIKTQKQEDGILSISADTEKKTEGILEDEERYYLEPLE
ncbi:MAG: hypothetical protein V1661_03050 [bacterium]